MFYQKEKNVFKAVASRRQGEVRTKIFSSPILSVPAGDKELAVAIRKKGGKAYTVISCDLPGFKEYVMNLTPQDYGLIKIEVGYGVQDIVFNDKDFDRRFIV